MFQQTSTQVLDLVAVEVVRAKTCDGLDVCRFQGEHLLVQDVRFVLIVQQIMDTSHSQHDSRLIAEQIPTKIIAKYN